MVDKQTYFEKTIVVQNKLPLKQLKSIFFSLFNSFSVTNCFLLFELTLLLNPVSLVSKSVLFIKFSCFILAASKNVVSSLNSEMELIGHVYAY